MRPQYFRAAASHRYTIASRYASQSRPYDAANWIFLYGWEKLIEQIDIRPGDRVLEVDCRTVKTDAHPAHRGLHALTGIGHSASMWDKAAQRIRSKEWKSIRLLDFEYEKESIVRDRPDVLLFSYSLSMIPDWKLALVAAHSVLAPGGQIGVVDFCKPANRSGWFSQWLAAHRVNVNRPYESELSRLFAKGTHTRYSPWAGLWSFDTFIGERDVLPVMSEAAA